jgi:ribosome-binding ATPase YchF (GTP1/OBG family)
MASPRATPRCPRKTSSANGKCLQLLTSKPVLFVANVDEDSAPLTGNEYSKQCGIARAAEEGAVAVVISAKIESELAIAGG